MNLEIIHHKILDPNGVWHAYRAQCAGFGNEHKEFCDWLNNHEVTCTWNHYPWYGWQFVNSVDDVIIRLQWADFFHADSDSVEHRNYVEPRSEYVPKRLRMG